VPVPGIEAGGQLAGVALIDPPGGVPEAPEMGAAWEAFAAAAGEQAVGKFAEYGEIKEACAHERPHTYLTAIGIRPDMQRRGLGGRLLARVHQLSAGDRSSEGVALDTQSASNVTYYRRHGYEVYAEKTLGDKPLWFMYRPNG
jgi:GNAT superfamily N-acetyltransferase